MHQRRLLSQCLAVALCAVAIAAQAPSNTTAPPTEAPPTPVPAPKAAVTVNPYVVGVGVVVLLCLFGASLYYVVVWPKRALQNASRAQVEEELDDDHYAALV
jgi:hypothetical protein